MQDNTFSTKQDLHFSEVLNYWFDSFKYFTNKNRFYFPFFDSPQMEMAYFENYDTIQQRMEFIKGFKAFDEINKFIKITFNGEKSRCEGFLTELRQSVERLEFSKTECWLKSMIEDFENENTQFDSDIAPPATYQMMHELYYLWNDAVSDCNKIFALYSNLPSVLPPQLFNQMNTPPYQAEERNNSQSCNEFDDLFPSVQDKEMVMKMLLELKIINSEGKYLLGTKRGIIRVFIDVMKEEGYFIDIERKPILRVFTPVILGRRVEVINEPSNFEVIKKRILIKLKEMIK